QEGSRLLASENPHAAVVALEHARELEPDKGSVRETLARAYFRAGRFPAARAEFARAVEIDPVNDYAHFGLGLCLLREGDRLGARRHLKPAAAMRPGTAASRRALSKSVDGPACPRPAGPAAARPSCASTSTASCGAATSRYPGRRAESPRCAPRD